MLDKFNLTKEQNLFLAKKTLVTNIYNSAKLEGLNTTFPETQTILEGINVPNLKLDEINCILNLKDAWKFVLNNINDELNLNFICKINEYVSRNESLQWGSLRNGNVGINGTNYKPEIPIEDKVKENINKCLKEDTITKQAIRLMLYLMRSQIFWDGNKRTSMIVANKFMIQNGKGIISVKEENINEFNKLLTEFYETNNLNNIEKFIYEKCIFGLEIKEN